ncbi:hypothetical protein [Emticicia oligotrophica]|uniref:hypothetical protein n=1 Tax=Emticicia oligotrophica TaxID=312279 RepID=UPI00273C0FAF|nr:hypothetical protein [Emticicia oligotrophica]
MEQEEQRTIPTLGSIYFAIKNISYEEVIKRLNISKHKICSAKDAFACLYSQDTQSNVIVSHQTENWIFLYLKHGSYYDCKSIVQMLLNNSKNKVNFYFSDSCIDCYQWIISENGKIIREFSYSMSIISNNFGDYITKIEKKFIQNLVLENEGNEFIFGEDVADSVFESTCEIKKIPESLLFTTGQINGMCKFSVAKKCKSLIISLL